MTRPTPVHRLWPRLAVLGALTPSFLACGDDAPAEAEPPLPFASDPSLEISGFDVRYAPNLDAVVFTTNTEGDAASVVPDPAGGVDGAPVLGYVFPTTLPPADAGFGDVEGTLALAVTSHPDFDDTPLWDEDGNDLYDDDGAVYHAHWVVLGPDERAPAGLAVQQSTDASTLPPTAPMPMYLDSPGFTVVEDGSSVRVVVPADRIRRNVGFRSSALTAYMQVDASGDAPLLAVHEVLSQWRGGTPELSVAGADDAPGSAWPAPRSGDDTFAIADASAHYDHDSDMFVVSMDVAGTAATGIPDPAGQVDGAPVDGYVFPTDLEPAAVGFRGVDGMLVLAVTSHPDFDDTPLWDETADGDYANDGATYHVHWAVLVGDDASPAGLSVPSADPTQLPPTAPMPMYLDSPGYHAFASAGRIRVLVPGWHLADVDGFAFDAVTAHMRVDASGTRPVLRVEEVIDVLSGDLSLPLSVSRL